MAPATLRIRLLGEFDLRLGEEPLPLLGSARAESLLAYLLLHRDTPQPRQRLAFLLWPDSSESQARTNLRHVLHVLRRTLPDADRFLEVTPRALRWREDAPWWLDVAAFEEAVALAGRAPDGAGERPALREAAGLYRGDLLESGYDEWLLEPRERLRRDHLRALERLVELLEAREEPAEAIGFAERLLRADPLREATYRSLMRLHDARGDRARALRAYHACAAALERELSVEPSAATRRAYEALLPPPGEPATEAPGAGRLGRPPLVGRGPQRVRLTGLWRAAEAGEARLVLVTGSPASARRGWPRSSAPGARTTGRRPPRPGRTRRRGRSPTDRWSPGSARTPWPATADGSPRPRSAAAAVRGPRRGPPGRRRPAPAGRRRPALGRPGDPAVPPLPAPGPPAGPVLVVATARREELDLGHPVHDLLTGLRALERVAEVEVGRLSRKETAGLAERLGGGPLQARTWTACSPRPRATRCSWSRPCAPGGAGTTSRRRSRQRSRP
jgi:DNA-binding SARP family transcriptional activator